MVDRNVFWRRVVIGKYGEGDHFWFPNDISSSFGVGVWKGIRKGWNSFERHILLR